jgi:Flp pilus assembly pilin Flp
LRGQSVLEYAILVGIVMAAILGMQIYAKRGIQAGIKTAADQLGDQLKGMQYESGDRQRSVIAAGDALTRESAVTTASDRRIRTRATAGGGRQMDVIRDTSANAGALATRGAGVSSYSETVVETH